MCPNTRVPETYQLLGYMRWWVVNGSKFNIGSASAGSTAAGSFLRMIFVVTGQWFQQQAGSVVTITLLRVEHLTLVSVVLFWVHLTAVSVFAWVSWLLILNKTFGLHILTEHLAFETMELQNGIQGLVWFLRSLFHHHVVKNDFLQVSVEISCRTLHMCILYSRVLVNLFSIEMHFFLRTLNNLKPRNKTRLASGRNKWLSSSSQPLDLE